MFKLPYIREYYELLKNQSFEKKKILLCGRRSGKSIRTLLSIAKEYLSKEQYQKLVEDIEAEFKPMIEGQKTAVIEVDDFNNWKSAN